MLIRVSALSCLGVCFAACGPGEKIASGKQGAAEALFAASGSTRPGADRLSQPLLTADLNLDCPLGGHAKLTGFQAVTNTGLGSVGAFDHRPELRRGVRSLRRPRARAASRARRSSTARRR